MTNRHRLWTTLALALAWGGATACDDTNGPPAEGDLRIVAPRTHLVPGETLELRVEDGDGTDVTDRVVWTTDDASTLAVDDGAVTGVAAGVAGPAFLIGLLLAVSACGDDESSGQNVDAVALLRVPVAKRMTRRPSSIVVMTTSG